MSAQIDRRHWLKFSSLAALGLGFRLPAFRDEAILPAEYAGVTGLVNLSSNENPYGISPKAREAIVQMLGESHRYSYNHPGLQDFKKQLAEHHGVSEDHILVTAGSGDALGLLPRFFNKGKLVTATPTFPILPTTAAKLGTKVVEVPLNSKMEHDLDAMLKAVDDETALVYICNPANPSTTIVDPNALKNFCIEASKKAHVLIDEAYIDYLEPQEQVSMISLIEKHPKVMVLGTFSKIHAMAGLRIGWLIATPDIIAKLQADYFSRAGFTLSVLSMYAALASLDDHAWHNQSRQKNTAARDYTIKALQSLNYQPAQSKTNFIFFPLGNYPGDFAQDMLKKNIFLRSYQYPYGKYARVSLGTMDEMKIFMGEMKARI